MKVAARDMPISAAAEVLESDVIDQISYWRQRLNGVPSCLELPTDRPRSASQGFHGARHSLLLPHALSESIRTRCEREAIPPFTATLAAFGVLLFRYNGQDDIVLRSTVPGRDGADTGGLVGSFAHPALIRLDLTGDPTFREFEQRVSVAVSKDCDHLDLPFERILNEIRPGHDAMADPLYRVGFLLTSGNGVLESGWAALHSEREAHPAEMDLHLGVYDAQEHLVAHFDYNAELFEKSTINRLGAHLQATLEFISANPDERISNLVLLTPAERHQLLVEWNDTQKDYAVEQCIHKLFEAQVFRAPGAAAVVFENEQLTFDELNRRANQLAHYLAKLGVGPDALVAICMERSLEMVIAILGILKAGGGYVPLDPENPKERFHSILEDADSSAVVTTARLAPRLPQGRSRIICTDSDHLAIAQEPQDNPAVETQPHHCAYVIFTSGSTGKPKGVVIPHRAIVNHMLWMSDVFKPVPSDRVLQRTPYTFDASVWEFYLPLISGATLEMAQPGGHIEPTYLTSLIARRKITIIQFVPAILRVFLEAQDVETCTSLRLVFCGGEPLTADLQALFFARLKSDLYNLYGPTECTIDSSFWKCQREVQYSIAPIGRPIANLQAYVLDQNLEPVPVRVTGELYIGGAGVGRGYLNRPELTNERFVPDPFHGSSTARMYKTGDLARYLPTGDIEYLGRVDHQLKLHGLRIELGEIETTLAEHPGIRQNAVVAQHTAAGDKRLAAYVVTTSAAKVETTELRRFLLKKLPAYMVPSVFITLPAMPLMPNGKVDRKALIAQPAEFASKEECSAPRDAVESRLAELWESILGIRPIGITNNFFELGGHSLAAVRLMYRIEKEFGKALPIATLFRAPTIEQLAAVVRQQTDSSAGCCLVPIQPRGSRPPFFCVHGAGGAVIRFSGLARHLGSEQPLYALQARGLDPTQACHTRVEDMAAHYIQEIRAIQPLGPYFLGGYSLGGMIAFEMAQQLLTQARLPAVVVLFDTFPPEPSSRVSSSAVAALLKAARRGALRVLRLPGAQRRAYVAQLAAKVRQGIHRRVSNASLPPTLKRVRKACLQAAANYTPTAFPGKVVLFQSRQKSLTRVQDLRLGWTAYVPAGLEVHDIDADHDNVLLEPQVKVVAEKLQTCLAEIPKIHSESESVSDLLAAQH